MPGHSKPQDIFTMPLNPMVFYARFQHIYEKIMENLNTKSLEKCREVSKSWMECIDNKNILWNRIAKERDGNKVFQFVCKSGNLKMARFLIQKSAEFKINLDLKDYFSNTGFHYACKFGHFDIADLLIQKSAIKIDFYKTIHVGKTAFHYACMFGKLDFAEILLQKSDEFNIDLSGKIHQGKTAFHYACEHGSFKIVEILV